MPKCRVQRHPVTQPQDPSYKLIPLTKGQNALVDATDYEWLSQWNWFAWWAPTSHSFYAMRGSEPDRKRIFMHKEIYQTTPGTEVDHKNGDTLDNRRCNLRSSNHAQNQQNAKKQSGRSSHFKGVTAWDGRWRARITVARQIIHLGSFGSAKDAAVAYDEAAKKYFGEFARLNF